jgi:hypothetical protein
MPCASARARTEGIQTFRASPVPVRALAVFVAAHGVAHFVGTSRAFARASDGGSLDYLGGSWTISDPNALRVLGILWALAGAGTILAALFLWTRSPHWPLVLGVASSASLALVVLALWASVIGLPIDVALLAGAVTAHARRDRRPSHARPRFELVVGGLHEGEPDDGGESS